MDNARQLLWLHLKRKGYTLAHIGQMCNRTHGAISEGIRRVCGLLEAGDCMVVEWDKKINRMSEKKNMIEIKPPALLNCDGFAERYAVGGFECPYCDGRREFVHETGRNEYKRTKCEVCSGKGKIKADIVVRWTPDGDVER